MRRPRRLLPLLMVPALLVAGAVTAVLLAAPATAAPATAVADDGAKVVTETWIDARTVDLTIDSPALGAKGMVRLFVPAGWKDQPTRTWPELWLLHGCCEPVDYMSWDQFTDAREFTADKAAIVVMPTDGLAGMYTNWWNLGLNKAHAWDTFHTLEVRQIVERGYRGDPGHRAVAGVSVGGYGALAYAFKHKGMFAAAASFSGIPNTTSFGAAGVIKGILVRSGFYNTLDLWGDDTLNRKIWAANNPYEHVDDLRGTALWISAGNGNLGPVDPPGTSADPLLEPAALRTSQSFTDKLKSKGIPATVDYYGNGTHSWPYWERELHKAWAPLLAPALGLPA